MQLMNARTLRFRKDQLEFLERKAGREYGGQSRYVRSLIDKAMAQDATKKKARVA